MGEDAHTDGIRDVALGDALVERYVAYALSTLVSRSLPDARDGLKPVHRRLLFAMRALKLDPAAAYKKCARVVGDVIGKFHPHGDAAVYEALVRLAQDFSLRYPLIEGHGNFGSIDGDGAAAMRYTEARLSAVAQALLADIDEDTVDFRTTYDGQEDEPEVLPAAFPNLLANGASGIAVGMATSIPPHHVGGICAALLHLIAQPDAGSDQLLDRLGGPDFPTGGIIAEPVESVRQAYASGRGGLRLRARWHLEEDGRQRRIVITEIPYQVEKARLIEQIATLVGERAAGIAADLRDESAQSVRIVLDLKDRTVAPAAVMAQLFRHTQAETRVGLNFNVLVDGRTPRLVNLKELLRLFLDHRFAVVRRRTRFRLLRAEERLEIVDGLLLALADLDAVIAIIREADDARAALMARFAINERQAEAILNLRLRQLRRLDQIALGRERTELMAAAADWRALLADDARTWRLIEGEIRAIEGEFGAGSVHGPRRTAMMAAEDGVAPAAAAALARPAKPLTVVLSERGWLYAVPGIVLDDTELRYRDGDRGRFVVSADDGARLVVFAGDGRAYGLVCDGLPGPDGLGQPLRLMIDLADDAEPIALFVPDPGPGPGSGSGRTRLVASEGGRGFVVAESDLLARTRAGREVLVLDAGERALACRPIDAGCDHVALLNADRRLLVVPLAEIPVQSRGKGVLLQRCRSGALVDALCFRGAAGLPWRSGRDERAGKAGGPRLVTDWRAWLGKRGQAGRPAPRGLAEGGRLG